VMAQNWNPTAPVRPDISTDNVFWGMVPEPPFAYGSAAPAYGSAAPAYGSAAPAYGSAVPVYGSVAPAPAGRFAPGVTVDSYPRIIDCVHVPFPQCSGGGGN
jgi:hypothetical protein